MHNIHIAAKALLLSVVAAAVGILIATMLTFAANNVPVALAHGATVSTGAACSSSNPDHCHTGAMRGAARPATTGKHGVRQGTR